MVYSLEARSSSSFTLRRSNVSLEEVSCSRAFSTCISFCLRVRSSLVVLFSNATSSCRRARG
ncbi:hypothetical protein D3C87_2152390 [compost metagenome]